MPVGNNCTVAKPTARRFGARSQPRPCIDAADRTCPYSGAIRGNVDAVINLV